MITKHYFSIYIYSFYFSFSNGQRSQSKPKLPQPLFPRAEIFSFEFFDAQINLYISRT
jgi:hypothetical protein